MIYKANSSVLFLLSIALMIIIFVGLIFGYIVVEVQTRLYIGEIEANSLCLARDKDLELKYVKLISYTKHKNSALIDCIFINFEDNQRLEVEKKDGFWRVVSSKDLNTERGLQWPVYV